MSFLSIYAKKENPSIAIERFRCVFCTQKLQRFAHVYTPSISLRDLTRRIDPQSREKDRPTTSLRFISPL